MAHLDEFSLALDRLTVAAGTDDEREFCHGRSIECRLAAAYFMPATAVSTDGSNYTTVTIKAGAGGTSLGSFTTNSSGGAALVKGTATTISLSGGTSLEFGATDCIEIDKSDTGTGAALDGAFTFVFEPIRV